MTRKPPPPPRPAAPAPAATTGKPVNTPERWTHHRDIRAEVTEWICFSMDEPGELDAVRPYFRNVDKIAGMPKGQFIAYNRDSGEELAGKLF